MQPFYSISFKMKAAGAVTMPSTGGGGVSGLSAISGLSPIFGAVIGMIGLLDFWTL